MDLEELRLALPELDWRFAKTMPDVPHDYIVRSPANEAVYVALFAAVKQHGTFATFRRSPRDRPYRQQYLRLGDGYKYWVMCQDVHDSRVINRARDDAAP